MMPEIKRSPPAQVQTSFVEIIDYLPNKTLGIPSPILALYVFLFGFFTQCNVITNSIGLRFLHITDFLVILNLPILYIVYLRIFNWVILSYILSLIFLFLVSYILYYERGPGELYTSVFILIYGVFSLPFTYLLIKERLLYVFCWGFLIGFIFSVVLLILDYSFHDELSRFGLAFVYDEQAVLEAAARNDDTVGLLRIEKAGGIWAAGNEAGPVFALTAAAAASLSRRYRNWWIYIAFLVVFYISFTQTLNRSGLISVVIITTSLYIRMISVALIFRSLVLTSLIVCSLSLYAITVQMDDFGGAIDKRFLSDSNAENNILERFNTLLDGTTIMLSHPFGIGATARFLEMQALNGKLTPHNGFVATAYTNGVIFMIIQLSLMFNVILKRNIIDFFYYSAICVFVAYMFEEANYNPAMMFIISIVMSYAVIDISFRASKRRLNISVRSSPG